jgi:hypothetical protein
LLFDISIAATDGISPLLRGVQKQKENLFSLSRSLSQTHTHTKRRYDKNETDVVLYFFNTKTLENSNSRYLDDNNERQETQNPSSDNEKTMRSQKGKRQALRMRDHKYQCWAGL